MPDVAELTRALDSRDPAVGLAAVVALRRLADELEALHVANAHERGWSWQEVAASLGVTRQAAHKKHGGTRRRPGRPGTGTGRGARA